MNQFIFEFLLFILFIITCLYLPGKFLLSKLKLELSPLEDIFLPLGLGIVIFTFAGYLLSWIKLEILILPIFLILDVLLLKDKLFLPKKIAKQHLFPLSIAAILSLIFSLKMLITGQYGNNIFIRHDDPWHLALINELKVHFPPFNPAFAGIPLKGYHFFYDFFASLISNIFFISPISLHFHLIPLFSALMWGLGVYVLLFKWTKKMSVGVWGVFLTMFGGSFAFIFNLLGHTSVSLDNGLGIGLPTWSLYNPPLTMSLIIILVTLIMILNYLKDKNQAWLIPLALCIGMVSMFKVYAGIILIGTFLLLVLFQLLKKNYKVIYSLFAVIIIFLGTFWLFAGGSGSLIFFPLWGPERLLQSFTWYNYDNKIYVYGNYVSTHSRFIHGLIGLILTYAYGLILFILGNLGTRLIGMFSLLALLKKKRRLPSFFAFLLLIMLLISIIIPLFFIQTGKVFEIIQMGQYYLFFASLLAAFGFAIFFELKFNKLLKALLIAILVIATIPHMYGIFSEYTSVSTQFVSYNSPYFQTMHYLSNLGSYDDTVLELPPKEIQPDYKSILDWYSHTSNPSLTALANKRVYFDNEFIDFPNLNLRSRINFIASVAEFTNNNFSNSANTNEDAVTLLGLLKDKQIKYVYSSYDIPLFNHNHNVIKIYQKDNNYLYKVR